MIEPSHSLLKRYSAKILSNLFGALVTIVTQSLVARILGPKIFGDTAYLTRFFQDLVSFLDNSSSQAFFTKLSQRPRDEALTGFYFVLFLCVSSITLLTPLALKLSGYGPYIWPNLEYLEITTAALLAIALWSAQILTMAVDARGLTVSGEISRNIQRIFALLLLTILYGLFGQLSTEQFLIYQIFSTLLLSLLLLLIMKRGGFGMPRLFSIPLIKFSGCLREFLSYCTPMIVYNCVGLGVGLLDRWLVQVSSGSIEQGYWGLSFQLSAVCLLFTSAILPVLTRELSQGFAIKDITVVRRRYLEAAPLLFFIAATLGIFAAMERQNIVLFLGGDSYLSAAPAVGLMLLYPIHQTYGQLGGAIFYASGETRSYRNIGITFLLLGIPLGYWLTASHSFGGLALGSTGLALKMVLIQFIAIQVQQYNIARLIRFSFVSEALSQLRVLALLVCAAYIAQLLSDQLFIRGIIYLAFIAIVAASWPRLLAIPPHFVTYLSDRWRGRSAT